jgi:hypothetical protein
MRIFTVVEARQHVEQQIRVLAHNAEARAEEAEQHAAETDDPDTKSFWEAQAKSARKIAAATHAECDELLRQLPSEPGHKQRS